jgi:hypothetical protein
MSNWAKYDDYAASGFAALTYIQNSSGTLRHPKCHPSLALPVAGREPIQRYSAHEVRGRETRAQRSHIE